MYTCIHIYTCDIYILSGWWLVVGALYGKLYGKKLK